MSLNIKDIEVSKLAKTISAARGITQTQLIRELLQREALQQQDQMLDVDGILSLGQEIAALETLDDRTPDEIIGYDENGLPA